MDDNVIVQALIYVSFPRIPLTMHGMPHAGLLRRQALLWGHDAAHGCHGGGSSEGLARPGYETLVAGQLSLHLLLVAGTTHKRRLSDGRNPVRPLSVQRKNTHTKA